VRNILFGDPASGAGGQDLFALDVQRGRDVGLPTYNAARVAYGLPAVTKFSQITSDPAVAAQLKAIYGAVNKVELFVGGIAEDHARGASVGPTFQAIIANQFERIRDGDRLWYQNVFSGFQLRAIQSTQLSDIIRANTNVTNIQNNVFVFRTLISGTFSLGSTKSSPGSFNPFGQGLAGQTVNLLDATDGSIVATTTTDGRGNYRFDFQDGLELGQYQIQLVGSVGGRQSTVTSDTLSITRGDQFYTNVNFVWSSTGGLQYSGGGRQYSGFDNGWWGDGWGGLGW